MARTHGHGNPDWTRDETLLALDLYFQLDGRFPSKSDHRVIELSNLLRRLPYHREQAKKPSFRNVDGVAFKLLNLRNVATGKGLKNVSAMDRTIWSEYATRSERVRELARDIRRGVELEIDQSQGEWSSEEDDLEFEEGRTLTGIHRKNERKAGVRRELLRLRRKQGELVCEMCGRASNSKDESLDAAMFDAHHLLPLAAALERKTRSKDMALLCANCHRLLHMAISRLKRWLTIEEGRALLKV